MIKKRILILEDNSYRIKLFTYIYGGECRIHIFNNAWDAIKALEVFDYDLIFLDHDLGLQEMVKEDKINGTGLDAAKALMETKNRDVPVIVHSCNPVGAENIRKTIGKTAILIPFGEELFQRVKIA
jgi:CheY-like chemotaxis protein